MLILGGAFFAWATFGRAANVGPMPEGVAPQIAAAAVLEDHYPAQTVDFPGGVKGRANVVFAAPVGFRPLTLDVYAKDTRGVKPRPLVIYVHGGGWQGGQPRQAGAFVDFPHVLADIAASGYVVASVSYRLSGEARFPAAVQDVKLAVRWLRVHAAEYGIDTQRVIIWGASAGGQLAGLVATSCENNLLAPQIPAGTDPVTAQLGNASDCVQGAVLWYAALNFTQLHATAGSESPEAKYLGCVPQACREKSRLASPALMIDRHTPPVLLVFGNADKVVPPMQSQDFHRRMILAGRPCDLLELPGIGHSFVGKDEAATRKASLAALDATLSFLHRIAPPVS
jgi:acetyl esterase/lipase